MKRIRVKQKFYDMKHGNCMRRTGEEYIEENDRADDLIKRGFCIELEELETKKAEPKIEKAVKESASEKATKKIAPKKTTKGK